MFDGKFCLDAEKKYALPPEGNDEIVLPDSTAHAQKGIQNTEPTTEYMTDQYYFEGYAWYSKMLEVEESWVDKKLTLFLERTRISTVYIDDVEIETLDSLCGYHEHDLTGRLTAGQHKITVRVNNTDYTTRGGHMTSPDTQTNWNGILGRIELQIREQCYPKNIQVEAYTPEQICVCADINGVESGKATVVIRRKTGETLYQKDYSFTEYHLHAELAIKEENLLWDEYHANLLQAEVTVEKESITTDFGIRKLSYDKRRLFINGKDVFLRGKHDGLVFPHLGYAPMKVEEWKHVFSIAKEYGINHYRFHTCCPPDAAFTAADEMGIYLEPELPFWGTIAAPGEEGYQEEEQNYLLEEGYRILRDYGNHPSFVIFPMGNELWGSKERINSFLHAYKKVDKRHLYTQGSNNFQFFPAVLEDEDIFCGVRFAKDRLFRGSYAMCDAPQGHIQVAAPDSSYNYDDMIVPVQTNEAEAGGDYIEIQYGTGTKKVKATQGEQVLIPQVPVISHEVGQYDFFPDFTELGRYEGPQQPLYLKIYQERMEKSNTFAQWRDFFKATGALAIDCYRREIETALRTRELSGFQLLDLQDFPGQCVALVGVLNAWMESKGLITASEWRQFCNDTVILAELDRFVVEAEQTVNMPIKLSVCNWSGFKGTELQYCIRYSEQVIAENVIPISKGGERLQEVGIVTFKIPKLQAPEKISIELRITGTEYRNQYTLWAYPKCEISITETAISYEGKTVLIAHSMDKVMEYQEKNQAFIYIPSQTEADIEGTYCTDFWNYPMFRSISESMNRRMPIGTLGLFIHTEDPVIKGFPCESYSTPQWYQLVEHSHCVILDDEKDIRLIVQPIDNVERCHKLGMLYYQNDVLVCTSRLWEIAEYPEVRAFTKAIIEEILPL